MTLIVGIKCDEGIVLGADGAATVGTGLGQSTARQPVRTKLRIHESRVVIGVSGPIGLGQRFMHEVEQLYKDGKLKGKLPVEAMTIVSEALRKHIQVEVAMAKHAHGLIGPAAATAVLSQTLFALPLKREVCLMQFDHQGAPELATKDLPCASIGSGQAIADPFLALLRRLLWPDREPTMPEGTFAVVWTLHHAIETNPGGVADPKQVVWLEKRSGKARELDQEELQEHLQFVREVEGKLTSFATSFGPEGRDAPDIPVPE